MRLRDRRYLQCRTLRAGVAAGESKTGLAMKFGAAARSFASRALRGMQNANALVA